MTVTGCLRSRDIAFLYCYNHLLILDDDGFLCCDLQLFPLFSFTVVSLLILPGKKRKMYQKPGFQGVLCQAGV